MLARGSRRQAQCLARAISTALKGVAELPKSVKIVEVGPRDGLQNEAAQIPTDAKVQLISLLAASGLKAIEATAFVSPKWVPQLADSNLVMQRLPQQPSDISYSVLVPNLKGLERALAAGAQEVSVFPAATEAFSERNLNASKAESLKRFAAVAEAAHKAGVRVRGYVSCAVGCPYQGAVRPQEAAEVARQLHDMGCYEVSMGDTIGVGTPATISAMFQACLEVVPAQQLAAHMHNTYGQAVANLYAALQQGISVIDSSVAGLGGCPFAPGASGNVATEDVCYLLDGLGIGHGVRMDKLLEASSYICSVLDKKTASNAGQALLAAQATQRAAAARTT